MRAIWNASSEVRAKWGGMLRNAQVVSLGTPFCLTMIRNAGLSGSWERDSALCALRS